MTRLALCIVLSLTTVLAAQDPSFEVASVRMSPAPAPFSPTSKPLSNLVTDTRVYLVQPLVTVLLMAFRVPSYQLVAPAWLNERFVEIRATIPAGATSRQVPEMLRGLLVERFGLVTHTETRMMDGYQLRVGTAGIGMQEVEAINEIDKQFGTQLAPSGKASLDNVTQTPDGPVRTMSIPGGTRRITSRTMYETTTQGSPTNRTIKLNAVRMTMAELVQVLTINLDEPVFDKTGLDGIYQFVIELPRDEGINKSLRKIVGDREEIVPSTASTLKAVETLGLKLERSRLPVDTLVVESMRRAPTEN